MAGLPVLKLVSIFPEQLQPGEPLPFALRDAGGRLLLAAGLTADPGQFAELVAQPLWAEEHEAADWQRRVVAAMDQALRQGALLGQVAAARPEAPRDGADFGRARSFSDQWDEIVLQLDAALRELRPGAGDGPARVEAVRQRVRALAERRPDASLYHFVYAASQPQHKYSCHHAIMAMLMTDLASAAMALTVPEKDAVSLAALTMNVGMLRLQDQLASSELPITPAMRATIDGHAATGAAMLRAAGFDNALALEVVRLHHETGDPGVPLAALPPARRLARLLSRVDAFAAKISRRATRPPMSPVQAAREACLGVNGEPDEIGGALLRAVGLYPPGSFVELVNGEMGIVLARGRRANLPYVASLVSAGGNVLGEPALRDSLDRRYAVRAALRPDAVKVRPPHERLLAMR